MPDRQTFTLRSDGANLDDAGVVGLVDAFEHSIEAGTAVATREPRLIRERTSLGETALHLLVLGSRQDAVSSILRLGADVRALCDFGESALSLAASLGKAEVVKMLLRAGAPVAIDGQLTPTLHKGVQSGNRQVVEFLIDAGADVNEQADFAEAPIHIAAKAGSAEIVELLLSRGADAQLKSTFGGTALDIARDAGHETCVVLLTSKH